MVSQLAEKKCIPCRAGTPPMDISEIRRLSSELGNGWKVSGWHHLEKEFKFKNFKEALDFTNRAGEIAESQGHHPDIHLSWGKVRIMIWTHKIDGLTESDFILAAKIDQLLEGQSNNS